MNMPPSHIISSHHIDHKGPQEGRETVPRRRSNHSTTSTSPYLDYARPWSVPVLTLSHHTFLRFTQERSSLLQPLPHLQEIGTTNHRKKQHNKLKNRIGAMVNAHTNQRVYLHLYCTCPGVRVHLSIGNLTLLVLLSHGRCSHSRLLINI